MAGLDTVEMRGKCKAGNDRWHLALALALDFRVFELLIIVTITTITNAKVTTNTTNTIIGIFTAIMIATSIIVAIYHTLGGVMGVVIILWIGGNGSQVVRRLRRESMYIRASCSCSWSWWRRQC